MRETAAVLGLIACLVAITVQPALADGPGTPVPGARHPVAASAQSCVDALDPQTIPPLTTAGNYTGNFSGQYPRQLYNRSNSMPGGHRAAGNAIGNGIRPLNASGGSDPNGTTLIVGIGDEHASLGFGSFTQTYINGGQANASVRMVNGAMANYSASRMNASTSDYWTKLAAQVNSSGYTLAQVQVALVKASNDEPQDANGTPQAPNADFATAADKDFPRHSNVSAAHLRAIVTKAKALFPNLKQAYVMSREYQGWSCAPTGTQYREPVAFEEGFPVKWTVTAQIDGDPALNYTGPGAKAPWLSWGPYLWNSSWNQSWYAADGSVPAQGAQQEVARLLFGMLDADSTSRPWFHRATGGGNAPTVSRTFPNNQSTGVSIATPIGIVFSRPMDRTSTAAAFSVTPSTAGNITWGFGDRVLQFRPSQNLQLGTNYTVREGPTAKAADGVAFGVDFWFWFVTNATPPSAPTIVRTSPVDKAVGVPTNARISIVFSKSMIPPTVQGATNISPPVSVRPQWGQQNTNFTLIPNQPLAQNTTYTVTIGTGAQSTDGGYLASPFTFSFTTAGPPPPPPTVASSSPSNGATGVPRDAKVSVKFSLPMNRVSVEGSTSITPPVAWTPAWDASGTEVAFTPNALLAASTSYTVTVGTGARSAAGAPLAAAYSFTFATGTGGGPAPPNVVSVTPADGATGIDVRVVVSILFSKPMDWSSTQGAISIAPQATISFQWNPAKDAVNLSFGAALSYSTKHTLTIATSAKSEDGVAMAAGHSSSFTTMADPGSGGGGGGGQGSNLGLLVGAGIAAAVVAGLLLFLLMRRRKKAAVPLPPPGTPQPGAEASWGPGASPGEPDDRRTAAAQLAAQRRR
jgi:hypothetical protein